MTQKRNGFTLAELLIVVAIIAVLVAISIPIFTSQLEKSREATDLANVRSAYAEIMAAANINDTNSSFYKNGAYTAKVALSQKQDGWQSTLPITIAGIVSESNANGTAPDSTHWVGKPKKEGSCVITFSESTGVVFDWTGSDWKGTIDKNKRWLINKNTGEFYYGDRNPGEGEVSLNAEPMVLSKGTKISLTPETSLAYSYYILDQEGKVLKDSFWVTPSSSKSMKEFTIAEDGYQLVVVAKFKNAAGNACINVNNVTDEDIQHAIEGIKITTP